MVIGIFGEPCVGKTTLAEELRKRLGGEIWEDQDYRRMARYEAVAKKVFKKKLEAAVNGGNIVYVISEEENLALLPEKSIRVLMTAQLSTILARVAARHHGKLPEKLRGTLVRNHGCFDETPHHIHVVSETMDLNAICNEICGGTL